MTTEIEDNVHVQLTNDETHVWGPVFDIEQTAFAQWDTSYHLKLSDKNTRRPEFSVWPYIPNRGKQTLVESRLSFPFLLRRAFFRR